MSRTSRRAVLGCLAVLVLATVLQAVALLIGAGPSTATSAATAVDGHPQRIGFVRPAPPLPDRPGPLAGTFYDNDFGNRRNLGLGPQGQVWALPPGGEPSLSPDGRLLLTATAGEPSGRWQLHDLVTGARKVFLRIAVSSDRQELRGAPYRLGSRGVRWSSDGRAVLALLGVRPRFGQDVPAVIDLGTGRVRLVADGAAAGFDRAGRAVTVQAGGTAASDQDWTATSTDVHTGAVERLVLRPHGPWRGLAEPQPGASVSPDGRTLLLVEAGLGSTPDVTVRRFSLDGGRELDAREVADWDHCDPTWSGADPVVPTRTDTAHSVLLGADGPRSLVAVHHRMQSFCLVLAADAVAAGPHTSFLGTRDALWTWYWRELLLGLTVAATAAVIVALRLLRRRQADISG
ncbi:hypothetical protein [Nocardioides deserti]|uniref:WD40 repeat domain-containing protein n=1 Tax=Nocardioides deserti TaxID=1588644 RepID=A0ABR6U5T4_9ACTN|nr:hypothetical protein [Nocardioides deserti]MBC2959791.1 hypothetical protein [Nocardioides deserti]GGO75839.1 hypothetical protein GCM10012276_27230 [Nocardioides deserti]